MNAGPGKIALRERRAAQRQLGANMLPERAAFPAFPRLEFAVANELGCFPVLPGLIVKRAKFDAQIIAFFDEIEPFGQLPQPPSRLLAKALPKLVALIEQPRIVGIGEERAFISYPCLRSLITD